MKCKIKSNLKLKSNIVLSSSFDNNKSLPFDLLERTHKDTRMAGQLTIYQRNELTKSLYFAEKIISTQEKYLDKEENKDVCMQCKFKDICI
ncbi:MAG: hypothetical protein R3Y60_02525 [bacterium]